MQVPGLSLPPGGFLEINEPVLVTFVPDVDGVWEFFAPVHDFPFLHPLSLYRGEYNLNWDRFTHRRDLSIRRFMRAGQVICGCLESRGCNSDNRAGLV